MKNAPKPKQVSDKEFSRLNPNAAGIDLGADQHWVSVPDGRSQRNVRSFRCYTVDLYQMADWLTECGIETVALSRSNSALGAYYRRMRSRLGGPQAITATAHKLARIFDHLWTTGDTYVAPELDAYEQKYRQRLLSSLEKKAQALGFALVPSLNSNFAYHLSLVLITLFLLDDYIAE